jgi:hypothetical protein
MDTLKPPAEMTDQELLREWECIDCDTENKVRTEELVAELEKRQIDI